MKGSEAVRGQAEVARDFKENTVVALITRLNDKDRTNSEELMPTSKVSQHVWLICAQYTLSDGVE